MFLDLHERQSTLDNQVSLLNYKISELCESSKSFLVDLHKPINDVLEDEMEEFAKVNWMAT